MDKDVNVLELLEFLMDTVDRAPKVPMSGKVMLDRKEMHDTISEIIHYFPKEFKTARWVTEKKEEMLLEAKRDLENVKVQTEEMKRKNIENHDLVRDAKIRANEILAAANKEAKAIRIGSREYSTEMLTDLDMELEKKRVELIKSMQLCFEKAAREIDNNLSGACYTVRENVKELQNFK